MYLPCHNTHRQVVWVSLNGTFLIINSTKFTSKYQVISKTIRFMVLYCWCAYVYASLFLTRFIRLYSSFSDGISEWYHYVVSYHLKINKKPVVLWLSFSYCYTTTSKHSVIAIQKKKMKNYGNSSDLMVKMVTYFPETVKKWKKKTRLCSLREEDKKVGSIWLIAWLVCIW